MGVGRVATKELKAYREDVLAWAWKNKPILTEFFKLRDNEWKHAQCFSVDSYFVFKRERIWSQKNEPKRLDASNRLKAFHDSLSSVLGIDDKYFFGGRFEKITGENECVIVFISVITPITSMDILATLTGDVDNTDTQH